MYWALRLQEDSATAKESYLPHFVTYGTEDEG